MRAKMQKKVKAIVIGSTEVSRKFHKNQHSKSTNNKISSKNCNNKTAII